MLPNLFRPITVQIMRQRIISETEIALFEAKLAAERAAANVELLQNRLERLKNEHEHA